MAFEILNEADATYGAQAEIHNSHIDDLVTGIGGIGVTAGCDCFPTSGLDVAWNDGTVNSTGVVVPVTSGSATLPSAHATYPRIDVLAVEVATGVVSVVSGVAAARPIEPDIGGSAYVKLWSWYVPATATTLTAANGTDRRIFTRDAILTRGLATQSFIYNSSGTQEGTRYNNWLLLMQALADTQYGGPRNILFEQNEVIPAGAWDLTDVTLLGNGFGVLTGSGIILYLDEGCTFTQDITRVGAGLAVFSASSTPIMSNAGSRSLAIYLSDGAAVACPPVGHPYGYPGQTSNAAPFIESATTSGSDNGLVTLAATGTTCIFGGSEFGFLPIVSADSSLGGGIAVAYDQSGPNTYWGNEILTTGNTRTVTVIYNDPGPASDPTAATIDGAGGSYSRTLVANPAFMAYTPAVSGNWSSTPPSTIAEAINRLAAHNPGA